jgi:hypothetical protein
MNSHSTWDSTELKLISIVVSATIVTTAGCLGGLSGYVAYEDSQTSVPFVAVNERGAPVHVHVIVENTTHSEPVVNENLTIKPNDQEQLATLRTETPYNIWVEVNQSGGKWHRNVEISESAVEFKLGVSRTGAYLGSIVE